MELRVQFSSHDFIFKFNVRGFPTSRDFPLLSFTLAPPSEVNFLAVLPPEASQKTVLSVVVKFPEAVNKDNVFSSYMGSTTETEYAAFLEKVRRTVYIDNLSPQVTESVVRTALNQFGSVKNVQFIPNYMESRNIPHCALVEMEDSKQAKYVVSALCEFPFMMSGMPRPVRAQAAEVEMFDDRPIKPGRRIQFRWLEPSDPDFDVAQRLKRLDRKHAAEASFVLNHLLGKEEQLAKHQAETLKQNYKKYESLESIMFDGTANRLARHYGMRSLDD